MIPLPDIFWEDIILPIEIGPRYFIGPTRKKKTTRRQRKQARLAFKAWHARTAAWYNKKWADIRFEGE